MDSDLTWNSHVEYIFFFLKKACKKLYSLRVLRRAGVNHANILKVYLTTARPVLEYALPVWQSIPGYLSDVIETVQKRALKIIFPEAETYTEALPLAQLTTLAYRREFLRFKYMDEMKKSDHPLVHLLPKPVVNSCHYDLRTTPQQFYLFKNLINFRTGRAEEFFTYKYFN